MFIVNLLLAGGVVYAGINTWQSRKTNSKSVWLTEAGSQDSQKRLFTDENNLYQIEERVNHYFTLSSLSVGLSLTGALVYAPLGLASVPLTIYTAIPTFEAAYGAVFQGKPRKTTILISFGVGGLLLTNHFFSAAFVDWISHYLNYLVFWARRANQALMMELADSNRQFLFRFFGGPPQSVWVLVDETELEIPFARVRVGDVVVVNEGELVPVDGVIVSGTAVIDLFILTGDSQPVEIGPGDHVFAMTLLRSGRICLKVERIL